MLAPTGSALDIRGTGARLWLGLPRRQRRAARAFPRALDEVMGTSRPPAPGPRGVKLCHRTTRHYPPAVPGCFQGIFVVNSVRSEAGSPLHRLASAQPCTEFRLSSWRDAQACRREQIQGKVVSESGKEVKCSRVRVRACACIRACAC